jgi:hypothetical protein
MHESIEIVDDTIEPVLEYYKLTQRASGKFLPPPVAKAGPIADCRLEEAVSIQRSAVSKNKKKIGHQAPWLNAER